MNENSNVSYGVELEKLNEKQGQLAQERESQPYRAELTDAQKETDSRNRLLAARVAALPEDLRLARQAAIDRSL